MRKIMTLFAVFVMLLLGFIAVATPIASDDGCAIIEKIAYPRCTSFKNDAVPMNWDAWWLFSIVVTNPYDKPMENVMVTDRFGAEIEIEYLEYIHPGTTWGYDTKGKSEKVFLWWDIGTIAPGDVVTLTLWISTDINPAGHQEYTSEGCYELNSGAVVKYTVDGQKYSNVSDSIWVHAVDIPPPY